MLWGWTLIWIGNISGPRKLFPLVRTELKTFVIQETSFCFLITKPLLEQIVSPSWIYTNDAVLQALLQGKLIFFGPCVLGKHNSRLKDLCCCQLGNFWEFVSRSKFQSTPNHLWYQIVVCYWCHIAKLLQSHSEQASRSLPLYVLFRPSDSSSKSRRNKQKFIHTSY